MWPVMNEAQWVAVRCGVCKRRPTSFVLQTDAGRNDKKACPLPVSWSHLTRALQLCITSCCGRWAAIQLDLVAWFARGSCMQPARIGQRPTLVMGQIRLRHACYVIVAGQRSATASQSAGWYRPTACGRTDGAEVTAPHFSKNVLFS